MFFFNNFIKNPQTKIALTFLTHIISGIDGVCGDLSFLIWKEKGQLKYTEVQSQLFSHNSP